MIAMFSYLLMTASVGQQTEPFHRVLQKLADKVYPKENYIFCSFGHDPIIISFKYNHLFQILFHVILSLALN